VSKKSYSHPRRLVCHCCGATALQVVDAFSTFERVTSDCKPWPAGGRIGWCDACGLAQAVVDERWEAEIREIYAGYTIYSQGGGAEQSVFAAESPKGTLRSDRLVEQLIQSMRLPLQGRLLDVGCGNGAFLRAFARARPGWELWGTEVDGKYRTEVESIPGVKGLLIGGLGEVTGQFDLVSLIHVLEHIPGPKAALQTIQTKLTLQGRVVIEVPDCVENPFALVISDHCSHFSPAALSTLLSSAGLQAEVVDSWVPREISAVACSMSATPERKSNTLRTQSDWFLARISWLEQVKARANALCRKPNFGIFGAAIAGTWVDAQTNRTAAFFVDEDCSRVGKRHVGRPILSPQEVPKEADVFIALPISAASKLASRLDRPGVRWHLPTE